MKFLGAAATRGNAVGVGLRRAKSLPHQFAPEVITAALFSAALILALFSASVSAQAPQVKPDTGSILEGLKQPAVAPQPSAPVLPHVDEPAGRTYRLLRETRMAAVVCELFSRDEPSGAASLMSHGPELALANACGVL